MKLCSSASSPWRVPSRPVVRGSFIHGVLLLLFFNTKGVSLPLLEFNEEKNCNKIKVIQDGLNGTIKTTGYPESYPESSQCEIQLLGNATHRVLVRFLDFYLFHPLGQDHINTSCDGLDKLQIYDGIRDEAVLLGEFCGSNHPLPVMSSGSSLTLNLTTYAPGGNARGFSASYAFVSNYGIASGQQIPKENCSFRFKSHETKIGKITSPNPGGYYPRNTNCTYKFTGHYEERILLKFKLFDLEGIAPCTVRSGSDYLEFSSLPGLDPSPARRCGRFAPEEVVSEGPYFRVDFVSNDKLDGLGFAASYHFITEEKLPKWVLPHNNKSVCLSGGASGCAIMFFLLLLANRFSFRP